MRGILEAFGILWAFSLTVIFVHLWFVAWANGGSITIAVDAVGEMWPELVLWFVSTPLLTLGLAYWLEGSGEE